MGQMTKKPCVISIEVKFYIALHTKDLAKFVVYTERKGVDSEQKLVEHQTKTRR